MIEDDTLGMIGTIIVDEVHQITEVGRGSMIELVLTKVRLAQRQKAKAAQGIGSHG